MMSPSSILGLSGMELYNELIRHGYPAGPVVASTRKLYERKLLEILEREQGTYNDEQEDKEEEVTQEEIQDKRWRQLTPSRVQEPQSNLGTRLSYSRNETIGQGGMQSQSNSLESSGLSCSRWAREISGSTVFKTPYSSMSDEDPLQSYRRNYPDTTLGQTGLSSRYSLSTAEFASGLARRGIHQKTKIEVPLKTKTRTNLRMILYAVFIVATLVMLYFILQCLD